MQRIYIDVGSSTVKVYQYTSEGLKQLETKSIHFKDGFDPEKGLTPPAEAQLIHYVKDVKKKLGENQYKVFATAIFRKLSPMARNALSDKFFLETGSYFNIVSHELEGHYLEHALSSEYGLDSPLLLINIGGGSTELVVKEHGRVNHRYNLELGVGTVLRQFSGINNEYSEHTLEDVTAWIVEQLPIIDYKTPYAIYNGGELTYMRLVGYKLENNIIFEDSDHPSYIEIRSFSNKNEEVFKKISLAHLEELMPDDPLWMHGARACSAIAQSIAKQFGVEKIIPSDSNMVHGIIKQEHRGVVLSGSFRKHLDYILSIKDELSGQNIKILSPRFKTAKNPGEEFVVFDGEEGLSPLELERYHLDMINKSDALVVCALGGYVGASALIEIGYAHALGKRIIFTEQPEEFMLRTLPAEIGL